jgi:hypothetical protein
VGINPFIQQIHGGGKTVAYKTSHREEREVRKGI